MEQIFSWYFKHITYIITYNISYTYLFCRLKKEYENYKREAVHTSNQLHERLRNMEQHLSVEKAACDAEKRRNILLQVNYAK